MPESLCLWCPPRTRRTPDGGRHVRLVAQIQQQDNSTKEDSSQQRPQQHLLRDDSLKLSTSTDGSCDRRGSAGFPLPRSNGARRRRRTPTQDPGRHEQDEARGAQHITDVDGTILRPGREQLRGDSAAGSCDDEELLLRQCQHRRQRCLPPPSSWARTAATACHNSFESVSTWQ